MAQACACNCQPTRPPVPCLCVQAGRKRLLRVLGAVMLLGAANHAYNSLQPHQEKGWVSLAWGGGSAVMALMCLWRGAGARGRQGGAGPGGKAD